jgi:membrane-associated protease RseP (regulator of RpoE activity)
MLSKFSVALLAVILASHAVSAQDRPAAPKPEPSMPNWISGKMAEQNTAGVFVIGPNGNLAVPSNGQNAGNDNTYVDAAQIIGADLAIEVRDPQEELLGATLASLSDALRSQLNVPAGQGLLVASMRSDGPSAQAGLKPYDVLLTLAEKPLTAAEDFSKLLKAAGEKAVSLKLLRAGKEVTLQVRPVYRVTLGPVPEEKKEYYLGISLGELDEPLRSQLGLSAGHKGVIISNVIKDSPAEKVGLQPHDIVLEYGGMPIDSPEKLAAQVQAGQEKSQAIRLLRAGKPMDISIQAAVRNVESLDKLRARSYIRVLALRRAELVEKAARSLAEEAKSDDEHLLKVLSAQRLLQREMEAASSKKIEELQLQVQSLQRTVEEFRMMLKSSKAPKTGNP